MHGRFNKKMERTPSISIGIPVYNGAKFIRETLDSLLSQTFTDFELIISDNASSDDTEIICREYANKDGRIKFIRQQVNLGAKANYQFVLESAIAQYFMWAQSDDVYSPNWLDILFNYLESNKESVGVVGKVKITDESLQVIREYQPRPISPKKYYHIAFREFTGEGGGHMISGLYRRWVLFDAIEKQKWNSWSMDIPVLLRIASKGAVSSVAYTFFFSRDRNSSLGKSLSQERIAGIHLFFPVTVKFYNELYDACPGKVYNKIIIVSAHFIVYFCRHYVRFIKLLVINPLRTFSSFLNFMRQDQ